MYMAALSVSQMLDRLNTKLSDSTDKTFTSAAYLYVADISNGTNTITALKPWSDGLPSPVMFEQLGDAAAVWQVLTASLTTTGTTGKQLTKLLTTGKFLGLK